MFSKCRADEPVYFLSAGSRRAIRGSIVIEEKKQFARRALSEFLSTYFPCFRYTIAQQPTSRWRILSPT
jgi:hypothetical protein